MVYLCEVTSLTEAQLRHAANDNFGNYQPIKV